MDGVLVDSEPLWTLAEVELARELGGEWTDEVKALVVGTRLDVSVPTILRFYGAPVGPADVAQAATFLLDRMIELYRTEPVLMPGAPELLRAVRDAGIPVALVSSSYRALVDSVLAAGVGPFELTLAGDEVTHAKPHPEPYLTAADRLGVDPVHCVVVEDSPSGVAAAEAAGAAVVAVPSVPGVLFDAGPRRLVTSSLAGVALDDLRALVA
jgi:HAD superfamily hydrolase (TIGR01509 family)